MERVGGTLSRNRTAATGCDWQATRAAPWMRGAPSSEPGPPWGLSRRLSERELDPKDVLADLFEEMLLDNPAAIAEMVIERLRDAGFVIKPVDYRKTETPGGEA